MKIRVSLYKGYTKGTDCTQKLQTGKIINYGKSQQKRKS